MKKTTTNGSAGSGQPVQESGVWAFVIAGTITALIALGVKYLV